MASQNPNSGRTPMYPQIYDDRNPNPSNLRKSSSLSSIYPKLEMKKKAENLFPESNSPTTSPSAPPISVEETIITVPGAILHLIDKQYSVELACGDFSVIRLMQGDNVVAVLARTADEIQWPLLKDEAAVKLDHTHYFFSFRAPKESPDDVEMLLNYGLTIASKGQDDLLKRLDEVLDEYTSFSKQKVEKKKKKDKEMVEDVLEGSVEVAMELAPEDLEVEEKKEEMEQKCQAYWTTLAPNVEDYSGIAAKLIAAGSGQLIKGILWCGDVTVERLKWGNEVMKQRMTTGSTTEISPETLKRIKRVKKVTKMTEKVAVGVLSGVIKVSGFFTSSVTNSKAGKKFFGLLPGEMVLASLDGFNKICDAVEVAGKNVMSTSSTVTTELVSQKYGEQAAKATNEGLEAAGHAIGTAWTVFKIRKGINPKSVIKPSALAKSAAKSVAAEKAKKSK